MSRRSTVGRSGLGIVTGLAAEAAIARGLTPLVRCSGGDAGRAAVLAEELAAAGVSMLWSFGIAGGLAPTLGSGRIVLATEVLTEAGSLPADRSLLASLAAALPEALPGPIRASEAPVATPDAKTRLHRATGALAVDMESGAVARVAQRHGLPFAAIRTIADTARETLPPAALVGLDAQGRPALAPVLQALAHRPAQLPALLRLAWKTRIALTALGRVRGRLLALGPGLSTLAP